MGRILPKVSVIIPCYNSSRTISDCIRGLINQYYIPYEIIVVDDCSVDNTLEVLQSFENIVLLRNDRRRGPAYSRNKAIKYSTGEILLLIDSDSKITDDRLIQKHVEAHINQDMDIFGGGIQGVGKGVYAKADKYSHWFLNIPNSINRVGTHVVTNNMSVKRSVFERIGFFNEELMTGEDTDFCERANKVGIPLGLISSAIIQHLDRQKFLDFILCFYRVGKDRIPARKMNKYRYSFFLPFGPISSLLYCLPLSLLLTVQVIIRWFPYDKTVVFYAPLIFAGRFAMAMGIVSFCFQDILKNKK